MRPGELDLTLTTVSRGKDKEEQTPMCGVPYHSSDSYIARLVAKGYKVAICEQMEDPGACQGACEARHRAHRDARHGDGEHNAGGIQKQLLCLHLPQR